MNANGTGHTCDPRDTRHAAAKLLSPDCLGNDGEEDEYSINDFLLHRTEQGPEATPLDLYAVLAASLLVWDPARLVALAYADDPTEQLDDGSLLRVTRTVRGFRIEHVTRSGGAPTEQVWEVDAEGRAIR